MAHTLIKFLASLSLLTFGIEALAIAPAASAKDANFNRRQMIASDMNALAAHSQIATAYAFAEWPKTEKDYILGMVQNSGYSSLPTLKVEGNKYVLTNESNTHTVTVQDLENKTCFIDGNFFKIDATQPIANQLKALKNIIGHKEASKVSWAFIDQAEAQSENKDATPGFFATIGLLFKTEGTYARGIKTFGTVDQYAKTCGVVDRDAAKISKKDFLWVTGALPKSQATVETLIATYKTKCTSTGQTSSEDCVNLAEVLRCENTKASTFFASVDKLSYLDRNNITASDRTQYFANRDALLKVTAQIPSALGQTPGQADGNGAPGSQR